MLNDFFISELNKAKEKTRTLLGHNEENNYRIKINLPAGLDKWDLFHLKRYYKSFAGQEITEQEIIKNKLTNGEKFTRFIVKKAKEAGYSFAADFELYASGAYDRKTDFIISTNPADMLSPSDFATYKSCFADGGCYSHGVAKWALMPGTAILFSQSGGKKTSRAWLYFYNENGKKGFMFFKNYGSQFDGEIMRKEIAKLIGIKEYKIKEYGCAGGMYGTYLDPFIAVKDTEEEDLKTVMIKDSFYEELRNQVYICPICGQEGHIRNSHIACCGSIKEALADYKRKI
jgi:hypothetical protein